MAAIASCLAWNVDPARSHDASVSVTAAVRGDNDRARPEGTSSSLPEGLLAVAVIFASPVWWYLVLEIWYSRVDADAVGFMTLFLFPTAVSALYLFETMPFKGLRRKSKGVWALIYLAVVCAYWLSAVFMFNAADTTTSALVFLYGFSISHAVLVLAVTFAANDPERGTPRFRVRASLAVTLLVFSAPWVVLLVVMSGMT